MTAPGADLLLLLQDEVYSSKRSSMRGLLPRREENQFQNEERVGEKPVRRLFTGDSKCHVEDIKSRYRSDISTCEKVQRYFLATYCNRTRFVERAIGVIKNVKTNVVTSQFCFIKIIRLLAFSKTFLSFHRDSMILSVVGISTKSGSLLIEFAAFAVSGKKIKVARVASPKSARPICIGSQAFFAIIADAAVGAKISTSKPTAPRRKKEFVLDLLDQCKNNLEDLPLRFRDCISENCEGH